MKRVFFIICVMAYCMLFAKAEGVVEVSDSLKWNDKGSHSKGESDCMIPVSGLSSGVYQVTLVSDGKTLDSRKISIRK